MIKKILTYALPPILLLTASIVTACAGHMYINPDQFGFIGGAVIKLAGLAPPEPVFKLKHAPVQKVAVGDDSEFTIKYKRPWRSDNVSIYLSSTSGIDIPKKKFELSDYSGDITINFSLQKAGFNRINIKVSGENKGEEAVSHSVVYIQAKKPTATNSERLQLSNKSIGSESLKAAYH